MRARSFVSRPCLPCGANYLCAGVRTAVKLQDCPSRGETGRRSTTCRTSRRAVRSAARSPSATIYVGVVPAPKTPLRRAQPNRRCCVTGRCDERRHGAGYLLKLDPRLGIPAMSSVRADARVGAGMSRMPNVVISRKIDMRISRKDSGVNFFEQPEAALQVLRASLGHS